MLNFIARRIAYGVLILLGVNLLTFMLFFTVNTPDDMARLNLGGKRVTQEAIEKWKVERGYDKPLYFDASNEGSAKITETIFWERSVSLFALRFGRADSESAGDIGHEVASRMWVSLQMALPLFVLQVIASTAFALLLVMFRHSRLDFWGVVSCVLMLSISSLFYIIVGQYLFSRVLKLAPISGYAPGLDAVKFLVLPIALSLLARLGGEARLYRAMFLEEIGKDYVRTARCLIWAGSPRAGRLIGRPSSWLALARAVSTPGATSGSRAPGRKVRAFGWRSRILCSPRPSSTRSPFRRAPSPRRGSANAGGCATAMFDTI